MNTYYANQHFHPKDYRNVGIIVLDLCLGIFTSKFMYNTMHILW